MRISIGVFFSVFSVVFFTGCTYDDMGVCEEQYESSVISVSGDRIGKTGENIALNLKVRARNRCSSFESFKRKKTENGTEITPVLTYQTCGACPQNAPELNVSYQFSSGDPGTYTLRFRTDEGQFTEFTIRLTD